MRSAMASTSAIHDATLSLACELLARPSVTPAGGACLAIVAHRLALIDFRGERVERGGVDNLWMRHGSDHPVVCFAGHVDVVPPGPLQAWTSDPFEPTERGGRLYARGATDMKGPIAAAITAIERFVSRHPRHRGSIAVLLTCDEEGAATDGTAAVIEALQARGQSIDQCIVTEPTSTARLGDTIKNGRRGSLNGTLTVRGVQCHIAYPQRGRNPIHQAAPALAELAATEWDRGNEYFPPTSFQISNVYAGTGAVNVVPGVLTALVNFRFAPVSTVDALRARTEAVLRKHGLDYHMEWTLAAMPFLTPRGPLVDVLADSVRSVTGLEPALSTDGGTSDARFLAAIAREVAEFGPVSESAHTVDEHIRLADLAPLSRIYEDALERLLRVS